MDLFYGAIPPLSTSFHGSVVSNGKYSYLLLPDGKKLALALGTITETPSANPAEVRKRRYQLLYYAKKLLPKERIAGCLFKRVDAAQGVKVLFNKARNKANYGNLQRCANPWACPYCAAKITESRKADVKKAMDGHLATGGYVYLMTLTNSHNASHSLKFLKEGQRQAMRRFMGGLVFPVPFLPLWANSTISTPMRSHTVKMASTLIITFFCSLHLSLMRRFYRVCAINWRLNGLTAVRMLAFLCLI